MKSSGVSYVKHLQHFKTQNILNPTCRIRSAPKLLFFCLSQAFKYGQAIERKQFQLEQFLQASYKSLKPGVYNSNTDITVIQLHYNKLVACPVSHMFYKSEIWNVNLRTCS